MSTVHARPATREDVPTILRLIRELAEYEKLTHQMRASVELLETGLFGDQPYAEAWIGELDGEAVGYALFFHTYSTFEGRPSIYLEDLYVTPSARGRGVGKALFLRVGRLAVERGCVRYEWAVLEWNQPSIDFYLAHGARQLDDWRVFRLDGDALRELVAASR